MKTVLKKNIMKKQVPVLIICLILSINLTGIRGQGTERGDSLNVGDGPYIRLVEDTLKILRIENGVLRDNYLLRGDRSPVELVNGQSATYRELTRVFKKKPRYRQNYRRVDSIAVISDVHGHYDVFIQQLISNGICDQNLNWKFGKGHLVFLGDAFDRGDAVTQILWSLFVLQEKASRAGGTVHVLPGNHEAMILGDDLRYISDKYKTVESICNTSYSDLYSDNTVLGKWIRSLPVIITIDDIIFVHAGISPEFVSKEPKIKLVNKIFAEEIMGKDLASLPENDERVFLGGNYGPLWYRGYFSDTTFTESKLNVILDYFDKDHIVVGHTTHRDLTSLFDNKIIDIDAGIGYGAAGRMLFYKDGVFYEASISGQRVQL